MLDAYEILELERKWQDFNNKRNRKKQVLYFLILISILSVIFVSYEIFKHFEQKDIKKQEIVDLNLKKQVDELKQKAKQAKLKFEADKNKTEEQATLATDEQMTKENLTPMLIVPNKQNIQNTKQLISQAPEPTVIEEFDVNQSEVKEEKQNKIFIESKEMKLSIASLKKKFESTNDIKFAISIAQEYYRQQDYKNAMKWAFTINNMDKDRVEGWIIFAKSKYKTGKKDDAINVLNTINKKQPSKSIDALLTQIKMGTL
ncbi:CDC27 family protein [Campylobacter hyointestinalis]|uniref:CDC27 family protein n=1 Tax=Campylobacter hyointestinalis TaxID=198 RepID=UPI0025527145|nr:CDC27 family protein [Campylobacter hyointestinalis]MDL2346875.1 CDC27 family protein [Campylobacter hyointestinalis]MDL2348514.1 CDC27 family protein [Campylobacter hyointestinalis]MDL2350361.1 CDC27 family protein [Campylobacter hyointestinalis]MDM1026090.1 CDC27 family protein [Campylobacter hyointestinalis]MDM1027265.1 CDC27 family protein [Campylobacter hyointestinalis]